MKKVVFVLLLLTFALTIANVFAAECTDTDGGKNYYVKGSFSYRGDNGAFIGPVSDSCVGNEVAEWYCEDGSYNQERFFCENGCIDGACLSTKSNTCPDRCSNKWKYCKAINLKNFPTCDETDFNYDKSCINFGQELGKCCSIDKECPKGQICNADKTCVERIISGKRKVILVIDKNFNDDERINSKIERYKQDNSKYEFITILLSKTSEPIRNLKDSGGDVKKNSLEVRNTIKQIYESDPTIIGVFFIGNIRPTIWRDSNLWRGLGTSGFYPSIYPLIALDDEYYTNFDVSNDGFYEKAGVTTGSEIGGGYSASIWGAVLIPPTFNEQEGKNLIVKYFDRNHDYYTKKLTYDKRMLYTNVFGCSSNLFKKIAESPVWNKADSIILCPNFHSDLTGFNSLYQVLIHNRGQGYDPTKVGYSGVEATTEEEKEEFRNWVSKDYFGDSKLTALSGYQYYLYLHANGRSISEKEIKETIKKNLPSKICNRLGSCEVYVQESGFEEKDGTWDGRWASYQNQQKNWISLYDNSLRNNNFQFTYLSTHGAPIYHLFGINSDTVKDGQYNSMVYEIESCDTGNYLIDDYIAGTYLFYGNTLAVSAYSIPFLSQSESGYQEGREYLRFLDIQYNKPIVDALFLKNYGNYIYFGDPLIEIPCDGSQCSQSMPEIVQCPAKTCSLKSEKCVGTDKIMIEECKIYIEKGKSCEEKVITDSKTLSNSCQEENLPEQQINQPAKTESQPKITETESNKKQIQQKEGFIKKIINWFKNLFG